MGKKDQIKVKGDLLNEYTGCKHYHSPVDIIAIKFKCCDEYYACYYCHQELAGHDAVVWKKEEFETLAIYCGKCHNEMTIQQYFDSNYICPFCQSHFNPKCSNHNHLYFEV